MEQRSTHLLVVALELGRTNSGHAFSFLHNFKTDPLKMYFYDWYNMHSREIKCKTPTCLLLNKEKQFVAFGFEAENKYAELVMDEEQDDYYFFDRFTMSLYNNENVTLDMVLKDKTGKQCSAVDIFTLSIKVFVNRLLEQLDGQCGMFPDDQIRWVLTVPAPWTDSAKQLMRESAEKAGLHPERLLLVTEPEAAVAYCHYIPTTSFPGSKPEIVIKDPGTSLMVVDLGDMTADIIVLQQTYNGQLKVLWCETGDECGRTLLDDRFCKMLEEIVGGNVIAELKREDSIGWIDLLQEVRKKYEAFSTSCAYRIAITIPLSLMEICMKLHGKDLKSVIDSSSYLKEVTLVNNKLIVKPDLTIKLFTSTIDSIITLMKKNLSNKSTIVMVGECSEYHLIQEAVQKAFPGNQVIIPKDAGLSVLKGAVLFGHRPDYIRSVKGDSLDDDDDDDDDDDGCVGK